MPNRGLEPKTVELKGGGEPSRLFIIYKMPAIPARRVLGQYKEGMSMQEQMAALLGTLAYAEYEGKRLDNEAHINAAITSLPMLYELESAVLEWNTAFFKGRKMLDFLDRMADNQKWQPLENVDEFIGAIISENKATMRELRDEYTLEEAFDIWEVIAIGRYNQWLANKRAEEQSRRR